jgi:hypothetical protein
LSVGDEVTVFLNTKVNEYQGKFYQKTSVWRLNSNKLENNKALESIEADLPF